MAPRSVRLGVRSRKLSNVSTFQRSVIGWVTKNLLSRAPPWFGRHVKPLVPAAFAVVSTHPQYGFIYYLFTYGLPTNPHWVRVVGCGPFSLCVIHKEGLCPSSGDINRLMMMTRALSALFRSVPTIGLFVTMLSIIVL
jgi:hypothetical protein